MSRTVSKLALSGVAVFVLLATAGTARAQYVVTPYCPTPVVTTYSPAMSYYAPVTTAYYTAPAVSYYTAPTVSYYTPAVSYYAPAASYYTPATSYYYPATSYYYAPTSYYAPVTSYYAPYTTARYGLFGRRVSSYYYPSYYLGY